MNRVTKYIVSGIFALTVAVYLATSLSMSASKKETLTCTGLKVVVADSTERSFVTPDDVKRYLDKEFSGYAGMRISELDLKRAEKIIDDKSAVLKSQAYITKDGILNITVTQREPVIRFQKADGGFYADCRGYIFPLQSSYTARVPIIDGKIPINLSAGYKGTLTDKAEKKWMDQILEMIEYMNNEKHWAEDIVQISVSGNGDIVMVPRKGKEKFIFGGPDRYEEKFNLMERYYTGILPEKGKDYYSTVNVKYSGQIICRK